MLKPISIADFLHLKKTIPLVDVRTPAEFGHGHVPGAFNLPLFTNEERVLVGTTYKQVGREAAILLGFDLTGNKWSGFIRQALAIAPGKKIGVHCWRGGMRSGAMAWALDLYGFEVYVIAGGYKRYRHWVHKQFEERYRLQVLGGMTGSGKTEILHHLEALGQQIIDLEHLAQHQGSAYGSMNKLVQPTQEQFENNFAETLMQLDKGLPIWVEDESLTIGRRSIPKPFWGQMREAAVIEIKVDARQRVTSLAAEYGVLDKDFLVESTLRIHKRLGPEQTKFAIAAIRDNRMEDFVRTALVYYDKTYRTGIVTRDASKVFPLELHGNNAGQHARNILTFTSTIPVTEQTEH
jgi:tRNA 2-selenouridine synthase